MTHVPFAVAGGPFTNGVATRAQSMQNAFTAVADDASAVYYNPGGLATLVHDEVLISGIYVDPSISYVAPNGSRSSSSKAGGGPSVFAAFHLEGQWVAGVGVYAAAARSTSFQSSPQLGGVPQSANLVRVDVAAMIARSWGSFSLGFGPVLTYGSYQSNVLGFDERGTGTGLSFSAGGKWELNEQLTVGLTYRGAATIRLHGDGALTNVGAATFTAHQRYPEVLVAGISWQPSGTQLRTALDIEYQNWSRVDAFDRHYNNAILDSISKTRLNAKDALALRVGGAWKASRQGEWRSGCSYVQAALDSEHIIPAQPDFDIRACSIGYGHTIGRMNLSVGIERQWMNSRTRAAPLFPGRYSMRVSSFMAGASYTFD